MKYYGKYATGVTKCRLCGGSVKSIVKSDNELMVGKMICHNCDEVYSVVRDEPIKRKGLKL